MRFVKINDCHDMIDVNEERCEIPKVKLENVIPPYLLILLWYQSEGPNFIELHP